MNNNVNTISENLLGILIKLLFITNIRMKVIGELLNLEGNHISKDNSAIIFRFMTFLFYHVLREMSI